MNRQTCMTFDFDTEADWLNLRTLLKEEMTQFKIINNQQNKPLFNLVH